MLTVLRNRLARGDASRQLLLAALIDWSGTGLLLASSPVFLVRTVDLTPTLVGVGFTVTAMVGIAGALPLSALADRWNPRSMLMTLHAWRAAMYAVYAFRVWDFATFVIVMSAIDVADMAAVPVAQTLVGSLGDERGRVRLMAAYRTVGNVGMTAGGLAATVALGHITRQTFDVLLVADCASFLVAALLVWSLPSNWRPDPNPVGRPERPCVPAITYALAPFDGVLTLYLVVLNVALPLWVIQATRAPTESIGLLYVVNTVMVVGLQILASRYAGTLPAAGRSVLAAGVLLALSCLAFATASATGSWQLAIGVLGAAVALLTLGEILYSAAVWQVSFALSPEGARSRGLATSRLGRMVGRLVGPVLMTSVVASGGAGWSLLALAFVVAAVAIALLVRRLT